MDHGDTRSAKSLSLPEVVGSAEAMGASGSRSAVAGVVLAYAAWGAFWGAWGALLPAVKAATGADERALGLALLGIAAGALPAMVLLGGRVDRLRSLALPLTLGAFALAVLPLGIVASPLALGLSLVVVGATSGSLDLALNARVAALEVATGRKLFNLAHAAFPLGVVVASPLAGWGRQLGVPLPLLVAVLTLAVLVTAPLNLSRLNTAPAPEKPRHQKARLAPLLLALGLFAAAVHLMENAVEQWAALFLETQLGAPPTIGGAGPAVYMGCLFLGRLVAQRLASWLDGRRQLALAGLSGAVGLALVLVSTRPTLALLGFAVAGLGMASGVPTVFSLTVATAEPERRGAAIARVTQLAYLGYLASPPLCGAVAQAWGLRATWGMLAAMGVLVAVAASALPRLEPGNSTS